MCAVNSILSRRVDTKESLFQMPSFTALVQSFFQMASTSKIHWANSPCGFDSRYRHHNCSEASCPGAIFYSFRRSGAAGLAEHLLAELGHNALFQPGDIGLGDAHSLRHLLLGQLLPALQAEAQNHNLPLPVR